MHQSRSTANRIATTQFKITTPVGFFGYVSWSKNSIISVVLINVSFNFYVKNQHGVIAK